MSSRSDLRRQLRARRRALSAEARRRAADRLVRVAIGAHAFRNARRIAFYFPADGEPDVLPLLERACAMHKHCYLPVLNTLGANRLWFVRYRPGDRLVFNRFGIAEPRRGPRHRIVAARLDLALIPLVGFDERGNRLGMGSGFYDRTLGFLHRRREWRRPLCFGVAYEFQRVEHIDAADWDVPLDGCLTEQRLYLFPRRGEAS
jgi:5-formyltetrahydrofolate cyclo-ligase